DAVDRITGQWRRERPDVADELWPMGLVGRIQRLDRILERELKASYAQRDLELWEADVLLTLRRAGAPYALTPGALLKAAMITSGAMTNRIDRLDAKGLVDRPPGPDARRGVPQPAVLGEHAVDDLPHQLRTHPAGLARLLARHLFVERALRLLAAPQLGQQRPQRRLGEPGADVPEVTQRPAPVVGTQEQR